MITLDLKCARDYPTPCLEPIAYVTEFTCRHDRVVQAGLCQVHGEGTARTLRSGPRGSNVCLAATRDPTAAWSTRA